MLTNCLGLFFVILLSLVLIYLSIIRICIILFSTCEKN